jgi:hypothetical protein
MACHDGKRLPPTGVNVRGQPVCGAFCRGEGGTTSEPVAFGSVWKPNGLPAWSISVFLRPNVRYDTDRFRAARDLKLRNFSKTRRANTGRVL